MNNLNKKLSCWLFCDLSTWFFCIKPSWLKKTNKKTCPQTMSCDFSPSVRSVARRHVHPLASQGIHFCCRFQLRPLIRRHVFLAYVTKLCQPPVCVFKTVSAPPPLPSPPLAQPGAHIVCFFFPFFLISAICCFKTFPSFFHKGLYCL